MLFSGPQENYDVVTLLCDHQVSTLARNPLESSVSKESIGFYCVTRDISLIPSSPHLLSVSEPESKDTEKQKLVLRPKTSFLVAISDLLRGN